MKKGDLTAGMTRVKGLLMELWGEVSGDAREFDAGRREQVIAILEQKHEMNSREAEAEFEKYFRGS